jgi:hypothetical protein
MYTEVRGDKRYGGMKGRCETVGECAVMVGFGERGGLGSGWLCVGLGMGRGEEGDNVCECGVDV